MSNPLLRPGDPRFQKPDPRDAAGRNQFAESPSPIDGAPPEDPAAADAAPHEDLFAAGTASESRPYLPQYQAQQQPRDRLWLLLGAFGWVGVLLGTASLAGWFNLGWISPLITAIPAATGWLLAYEDWKAIRAGAIDDDARSRTRLAVWFSFAAFAACLAVVGSMLYRQMTFLPDVF